MNRRSFFKTFAAFVATAAVFPRETLKYVAPEPAAQPLLSWIPCDGRLLRRSDYPELFRLLENKFGGDDPIEGTFCVPDIRGHGNYSIVSKDTQGLPIGMMVATYANIDVVIKANDKDDGVTIGTIRSRGYSLPPNARPDAFRRDAVRPAPTA